MTEAEQTFQLIKDLYLDESLPKTQRDYQKFNELLAAIKFRIKAKILLDVMKAKGEESIKVFDDAIAAIETKLQALESAPYGQDKTPAELMKEDFEANKRKYNAKVTAFRDYLALLKDLRAQIEVLDKNDPESVRTLVEKVFSPELKNDDQFQSELVASLALGYFDFTPLNGEYLPKGARGD